MSDKILIVDDEDGIRLLLADILEDEGYEVVQAAHSMQAEHIVKNNPDIKLAILDIWLKNSEKDGLELLQDFQANPDVNFQVLMISGHGNIDTAVKAIKLGAYEFIEKPFKTERLLLTVNRALEKAALSQENTVLKESVPLSKNTDISGQDPKIQQLKKQIEKFASTDSRILLRGDTGVGKRTWAKYIHKLSGKDAQTFGTLSCIDVNADDFSLNNPKWSELGDGTLLLNEVSVLGEKEQNLLLKLIQNKEFITKNIRVVSSTKEDIPALIKDKKFSEDLFYRLNVVSVKIPSLKERASDIELLVQDFSSQICEEQNILNKNFGPDIVQLFKKYDWPGNLRELKNVIEWLLIMLPKSEKKDITLQSIPVEIKTELNQKLDNSKNKESVLDTNEMYSDDGLYELPLKEARELFEKQYLLEQLSRFDGNISKVASFIGMERSALHRKLKSLGISSDAKMAANDS